jgi:glycosyltransferase involved in cell wall biosynthesis
MKNLLRRFYRKFRAEFLQRVITKSKAQLPEDGKLCIEVIGFFHSISGIGESARLCARQLLNDGYKVNCVSVEGFFRKPEEIEWKWENHLPSQQVNCRIYHLNPPMLPPVIIQMGMGNFKKTYNIGYWAWELETIPKEWVSAMRYMNCIMTPSEFTTNAIKKHTTIPVITVTHPVTIEIPDTNIRNRLDIPQDAFLISNIFSFGSAMERKNPMGLITAFKSAFNGKKNIYLVLKANSGKLNDEKQNLLNEIADHPNITLIDEQWERRDILGLIHTSNLYASLHRSEGFGLTLAEALLLGVPTMATAWSGNMDFCTEDNSFMISSKPITVTSNHPEFQGLKNATWADADLKQTADVLTRIADNPELLIHKKQHCVSQMQETINSKKYSHALKRLDAESNQAVH